MRPGFHIVNLGCKVNRVESDGFHDALGSCGLASTELAAARLVVVNTCTVTGVAEKKARKAVRHALATAPDATVVVTGCASAIDASEFARMSDRVEVVPKAHMGARLAEIARALAQEASLCEAEPAPAPALALFPGRERFGLKVQDGCSNTCSYCIVRVARGPESSEDIEAVVARARAMDAAGIPEIVLTGINLGRYQSRGADITALLRRLLDERLSSRIRLSSIEPDNVTEGLVELVAASDGRICRHFHLPMQSGSSKVLAEMNRHYDAARFASIIGSIKESIPSVSLTTDVIVGFPGETEGDFRESVELCRACGFSKVHVFPYSERAGTPAAERADQLPKGERMRRAALLREAADELRRRDRASRVGTVELAAVESATRATTESYHEVAPPPDACVGTLVEVAL